MTKALFVVSAADRWTLADGSQHPTGYWAEELAEPHRIFTEAGWEITIATPGGRAPTLDRLSLGIAGGSKAKRRAMEAYLDSISEQLSHPVPLDQVDETEYDLVFYPGGHGPMDAPSHGRPGSPNGRGDGADGLACLLAVDVVQKDVGVAVGGQSGVGQLECRHGLCLAAAQARQMRSDRGDDGPDNGVAVPTGRRRTPRRVPTRRSRSSVALRGSGELPTCNAAWWSAGV